ncbi:MAG: F0F1 ATP synthase subunit B [Bauldia sp.]
MATAPQLEEDVVPGGTGVIVETEAEHKVFPPFDSTTFASQFLWLAITFVLLYWLVAKIAIPRIAGILAERQGRISGDLQAAEQAKANSEAARLGYEKALADARASGFAIAETARNEAKAAADGERKGIEADLAVKLAEAEARIAGIKSQALSEVGAIAGEATEAIVKALVGADVARSDIDKAVADSLSGGRADA